MAVHLKRTALFDAHVAAGARMVPFAGWEMPLHYGSQVAEHRAVRGECGLFDVSHMVVADLTGAGVTESLRWLLANDVAKLTRDGSALYSCMLNETGGIVDDLIVYRIGVDYYRLVLNAATADSDIDWIVAHRQHPDCRLERRDDLSILALQGPGAVDSIDKLLPGGCRAADLQRFTGGWWSDQAWLARTGYTGEDGVELMLPAQMGCEVWERLIRAGVQPVGLGARDTLRLEAALNLYGGDMDETVNPFECGLGWTVAWAPEEREFIGSAALREVVRNGPRRRRVGLALAGGVMRAGMNVMADNEVIGVITSGGFGPTVDCSVALARVRADAGEALRVDIRGKIKTVSRVDLPFVRNGKSLLPADL